MMPSRSSVNRGLIQVLCALVLFAQQAALTHLVWHAAAEHSAQGEVEARAHDQTPAPKLAGLCTYDAAFGQVLGGAVAAVPAAAPAPAVTQAALHPHGAYTAADALTPRSRGPPVLL